MTRALNASEVAALAVGDAVCRIYPLGHKEIGKVTCVTPHTLTVDWPSCKCVRYWRENGRRTACHNEVLRVVSAEPPAAKNWQLRKKIRRVLVAAGKPLGKTAIYKATGGKKQTCLREIDAMVRDDELTRRDACFSLWFLGVAEPTPALTIPDYLQF